MYPQGDNPKKVFCPPLSAPVEQEPRGIIDVYKYVVCRNWLTDCRDGCNILIDYWGM